MAAVGFTPILTYASGTASNVPLAANLTSSASGAELALNYADGKLFYKDSGGVVQVLATKATGSIGGSTTQVQYNLSGALAGSANMTFNGTRLTVADLADSGLTSGRVVYASTGGALVDSANLTFDGTTLTANALTTTSTVTINGGTANGVAYLNGSKVLTTGSALTFDGSIVSNTGVGFNVNNANALYRFQNGSGTRTGYFQVRADAFEVWSDQAAVPMVFGTSNAEQMRLTSTGLGIGTSSPSGKLHTVQSNGINYFESPGISSIALQFVTNGTNRYRIGIPSGSTDLQFLAGGTTETMRLDSSGNLGLGVTPSAWKSNFKALMLNTQGAAISGRSDNQSLNLSTNWYEDSGGADRYINSDFASRYLQFAGSHRWLIAPSGTAGNAISFTQAMTLDASGNLLVGTTSSSENSKFRVQSPNSTEWGDLTLLVNNSSGIKTFALYNGAAGFNAAQTVAQLAKNSTSSRSLNAAGTVNASGADYAEYMTKNGSFDLAKGDLVGVDANGLLTPEFANAISFVVKSTDPSFVGGDGWGAGFDDDEEGLEAARQLVDRIAFCGQVPVNVLGATPGQYIVPVNDNGAIKGQAVSSPTFEQYQSSVGKVIAIEADGRARIIVKVA